MLVLTLYIMLPLYARLQVASMVALTSSMSPLYTRADPAKEHQQSFPCSLKLLTNTCILKIQYWNVLYASYDFLQSNLQK